MKCSVVIPVLTFLGFVTICKTDLDLYLDAHETYRLLGKHYSLTKVHSLVPCHGIHQKLGKKIVLS